MKDSPNFLPKGWIVETRPKQDGSSYKCYIAPSGLKFQALTKVYEYLKIEDPRNFKCRSSKRGPSVSSSTSLLTGKTKEQPDFLPEGWIVEIRPKQNGDIYKRYIDPSGTMFNSKKKVFEFLNIEDPNPIKSSKKSSKRKADVSSTSEATTSWEDTGEELPAGWISGVKVRKSDRSRKDSYYIDPVTGYIFHSRKDVFRYLATGEIGNYASKPKNGSPRSVQLTDGEDSPSNTAKRQKVEGGTGTRCLSTGECSNEMTVNSAKAASPSVLASQNSDELKKGKLLRSGKTLFPSLPAADLSADSNDSKKGPGKILVTDLPAPEISPDSNDSKNGRLLRSGKTFVTASPAPEISPDSNDSKKGQMLGSGQTLGTDLPAPEITPDAEDSKKGRLLRSGKTVATGVPAPENSPKKQLREIKGGVGKRDDKKSNLKSNKIKKEVGSPLRTSKRLSGVGVGVEPMQDIEIGRRKSLGPLVLEANPLMGGKPTISNHQVLEPVDQIGSALEPKILTSCKENGDCQLQCEKARQAWGPNPITRDEKSGEVQLECEKPNHKDGDMEKTDELVSGIGFPLESGTITNGEDSGEVQSQCERETHKDRDMEKVGEKQGCPISLPFGDFWSDPCLEFAFKTLTGEPPILSRVQFNGEVQSEGEKVITEKTNEKQEYSTGLPFGDSWPDPCLEFAFKTLTGEPKTVSPGMEHGEIQMECEKSVCKDRDTEKINDKPKCSIDLPFADSWADPCLEFAFKTLAGEPQTIPGGKDSGEVQLECGNAVHGDRDMERTNGVPESSMKLPFGDCWPDPCLEFAFKTLTGESKTIAGGDESAEVQSVCEKAILKDNDAGKTNVKPECSISLPFGDSWPDPCLEFAFKTLTGDFPLEGDLTIQDYFHPVQPPNTSDNVANGFFQVNNQCKFDPPERPSPLQLQNNSVFSAQGNTNRSTFGAKSGLQHNRIAGGGYNSINR